MAAHGCWHQVLELHVLQVAVVETGAVRRKHEDARGARRWDLRRLAFALTCNFALTLTGRFAFASRELGGALDADDVPRRCVDPHVSHVGHGERRHAHAPDGDDAVGSREPHTAGETGEAHDGRIGNEALAHREEAARSRLALVEEEAVLAHQWGTDLGRAHLPAGEHQDAISALDRRIVDDGARARDEARTELERSDLQLDRLFERRVGRAPLRAAQRTRRELARQAGGRVLRIGDRARGSAARRCRGRSDQPHRRQEARGHDRKRSASTVHGKCSGLRGGAQHGRAACCPLAEIHATARRESSLDSTEQRRRATRGRVGVCRTSGATTRRP